MTSNVKLLPLPSGEAIGWTQAWSYNQMCAYARANVEHHTAAQAAEMDTLRADAERYRWLRNCTAEDEDKIMARFGGIEKDCLYTDEYLDTAIDEAMMMKRYTE